MQSRHVAYISFTSCFVTFILDQATKYTFFDHGERNQTFSFFGGQFAQTFHHNYGITFNIPLPNWVILGLTLIAIGFILNGIYRAMCRSSIKEGLALGTLLGGALGNFIDRWTMSFVRDWMLLFHRSAFNVADIFILLGLIGFLFLQSKDRANSRPEIVSQLPS